MMDTLESVARTAILQVGALIREHLGAISARGIETKGPSDYVTQIDLESERIITEMVGKHFPDHRVISEETPSRGFGDGIHWIVDPLDGTTNFIHGFPFVAVSIGVCSGDDPILGLVLDPVREELFLARKGGGAFLNDRPIRVSSSWRLEEALIATGFPFRSKLYLDPYLASFKSIFPQVSGIRRAGAAALDLAYVACGRVDGFWEIGLAPWDVAAGALLVTEAGGTIDDFWGERRHIRRGHVVAGSPTVFPFLYEQTRALLAPILDPKDRVLAIQQEAPIALIEKEE